MTKLIWRFIKDETGATSIEYSLIAASIAVAIVVAVTAIGSSVNTKMTAAANVLK